MSTLLLHLPLTAPSPHSALSYTLSADGHSASSHGHAPSLAALPAAGRTTEVLALVPIHALSWQRVRLPAGLPLGHAPRLRAVLEGLLEDRLLDAPETLHFALAPASSAGQDCWVAVCARTWLQTWLQTLDAAGYPVARIVPEFAPAAPAQTACYALAGCHTWGTGNAHQSPCAGLLNPTDEALLVLTSADENTAPRVLPLSSASAHLPPDSSTHPWFADPSVAQQAQHLSARPIELLTSAQRALQAAQNPWDLAQLELSRSPRARLLRRLGSGLGSLAQAPQWRAARWGMALLAVLHLAALNAWAWQERQALHAKEVAVRAVLQHTFPHITVVVDARAQMQRELDLLRQHNGALAAHDLEPLLAATGQALHAAAPQAQVSALEYSNAQLRLRGLPLDAGSVAALQAQLQALGYHAQPEGEVLRVQAQETP